MLSRRSRHRLTLRRAVTGAIVGTLAASPLAAQRADDVGSSATLPRGALRISFGGTHQEQRDRYVDGIIEGIGGPLTASALGPSQFPLLGSIESRVQSLLGLPDFAASLGTSRLDARQRLFVTPLALEYGVTRWLTLGARTSLVRTKAEALFRLRGDSGRASLGVNPILLGSAVAAGNLATIGAYSTAAQNLLTRRNDCLANAGSHPECATILAEATDVNSLIDGTTDFAFGLTSVYGAGSVLGSPYVPLAGSTAEDALLTRVDSIRLALERYGVTDVTATTGLPLGAQAPLAAADLATLVTDPARGFGAKPLSDGSLTALGDVRLSAAIRLRDGRRLRQTAIVEFQLGTGTHRRPDRLLDQGTGTGYNALTVRSETDVALGGRFGASASVGATLFTGEDVELRVPSTAYPGFLEAWRQRLVPVTPGMLVELALAPRIRVNESITLTGEWQLRRQGEGRFDVASNATDSTNTTIILDGTALEAMSRSVEQRAGLTLSYSMLPAITRGLSRPPLEFRYSHTQTLFGHEGVVAKQYEDRVTIRYYARFLAR